MLDARYGQAVLGLLAPSAQRGGQFGVDGAKCAASLLTLAPAMARIAGSSVYTIPCGAFAAATVLGSAPLILLMLLFQRQIISGLTQGAIKG